VSDLRDKISIALDTKCLLHSEKITLIEDIFQAEIERLKATHALEMAALRERCEDALVFNEMDYPGDTPVVVGVSCSACRAEAASRKELKHKATCPLAPLPTTPTADAVTRLVVAADKFERFVANGVGNTSLGLRVREALSAPEIQAFLPKEMK
jgi:hypothetical protein